MDKDKKEESKDAQCPPIEGVQDVFDLPMHIPRNLDFSAMSITDYLYILEMAQAEIKNGKKK